jgi:hypothetical protein
MSTRPEAKRAGTLLAEMVMIQQGRRHHCQGRREPAAGIGHGRRSQSGIKCKEAIGFEIGTRRLPVLILRPAGTERKAL